MIFHLSANQRNHITREIHRIKTVGLPDGFAKAYEDGVLQAHLFIPPTARENFFLAMIDLENEEQYEGTWPAFFAGYFEGLRMQGLTYAQITKDMPMRTRKLLGSFLVQISSPGSVPATENPIWASDNFPEFQRRLRALNETMAPMAPLFTTKWSSVKRECFTMGAAWLFATDDPLETFREFLPQRESRLEKQELYCFLGAFIFLYCYGVKWGELCKACGKRGISWLPIKPQKIWATWKP